MNLLDRLQFAASTFLSRRAGSPSSGPPGSMSGGSSWLSGPRTTDAWGAKRGPSPYELIEAWKSVSYSCTHINADSVAAVPLRLCVNTSKDKTLRSFSDPAPVSRTLHGYYQRLQYTRSAGTKVADIREVRSHPLLQMLDIPDDEGYFDRIKLIKIMSMYMDVVGSCYIWPEYAAEGRPPTYLWPLYSQYITPIHLSASPKINYYQYFAEGLAPKEVIVFKHKLSLKDAFSTGFPPQYASIEYLRLEDRFVSVQEQLLGMGPRPALIVSPKDSNMPVGEAERQRFEQDLNRKHARGMQGGVIVTNGSWDLAPMSYSPTDLSGLKVAEYDLDRICGCFDVPVALYSRDTNLANFAASKEFHAENGVRPRCVSIANTLTRFARQFDERLFFAFDNCVRADEEREAKIFDMMLEKGRITINQANEDTEYPPCDWGNEPWLPTTLAQPSMLKKIQESNIKASDAAAKGAAMGGGNASLGARDKKKPKGKSNGSSGGSGGSGKSIKSRAVRGVDGQADATVHGREGLTAEGENSVPFSPSWERWSDPYGSRTPQKPS